jgi:diaminohydroxyphosphoribosylaminopyrimidine deaminase/5-amino-6-(5-phosphoribosylamino)uracil reductase
MQHAVTLAEKGVGLASPNPTVGCVLVDSRNQIVGEGFHRYAFRDHAEIVALHAAGEKAQGATAYVTLEPCSHHGRTGPCADALIAAGVTRVVVATLDANPIVRGNGVARLRSAGIAVEVGSMEKQAQRLNDAFAKFIRTGLPYLTVKAALSLDGRIAPSPSSRKTIGPFWLTGPEARAEVHRMRHAHDAVLTGIGTVLADDPLLTDRSGLPRRLPLIRAVMDTHLRTPLDSCLVQSAAKDVVIFTANQDEPLQQRFLACGITLEIMRSPNPIWKLSRVLSRLGQMGATSVSMEAGTRLMTTAIQLGLVDRLVLFYAPKLLGEAGLPFFDPLVSEPPPELPGLPAPEVRIFGQDVCLTGTLRSYWEDPSDPPQTESLLYS